MGEQHLPAAHRQIRRGLLAIRAGPWIEIAKEEFMGRENVVIGQSLDPGQIGERLFDALDERTVLEPPNDAQIFLAEAVAQVAAGLEIEKRIERHRRASRRYRT